MKKPTSTMMVTEQTEMASRSSFSDASTLGKLAKAMEPNAFGVLIDLVNWAKLWDQIYATAEGDKNVLEWDDATIRALLSPFLGFGNNPRLYATVSEKVTALMGREIPLWMGDPAYRKANSMVWCVLQSLAPSLASSSHGFTGQQEVVKILAQGFTDG